MKNSILVDQFLDRASRWQEEMTLLRNICLECELDEDFKWKHPCYTFQGKNIVIIHGFKEYCALLFHKGALLDDAENILIQQTENVQAARQIRFKNLKEVVAQESIIKDYILEAIEVEKAGLKVDNKPTAAYEVPVELLSKFEEDPELEVGFNALTPGRQRGYLLYFSQAKQSKTRLSRIEKSRDKIMAGKGYNDRM
ncbi:YdeI/OmpD-associated family protein [Membranihabitans marinus]|uniref:YdeI/OmpD-associated family protein n=1 Tax=Membranihabitans marinus TaxID=1227546 RepID=UPI001F1D12F9|nr:YdeI family protein [Membranihabitans marinus]